MNLNIFQELLVTVWFLVKMSVFVLTAIGVKVAWDRYGSLIDPLLAMYRDKKDPEYQD